MKFIKIFLILVVLIFLCACSDVQKITQVDYIKISDNSIVKKEFHGIIKAKNSSMLSFQSEGRIIYLPYSKGDFVKKGNVIARLDGELYAIKKNEEQAKLRQYEIQQNKQKSFYDRLNILHKEGAISDNDWESAYYELKNIAAQIKLQKEKIKYISKEISYNIIVAPFDGYIGEKLLDVDSYAKIGSPVVNFISSDGVQVEIMVDENIINSFKIGDEVLIKVLNANYQGKIAHISKSSLNAGGYLVKILLNEMTNILKEGMSAQVEVFLANNNIHMLPLDCVFENNNQKYVYKVVNIKNNIGNIEKKNIKTGMVMDNEIEVLEGVDSDDIVVLNYDESKIKNNKVKL